jgi:hypothetical protein
MDGLINHASGNHEPDDSRGGKFAYHISIRRSPGGFLGFIFFNGFLTAVENDAGVSVSNEALNHIATHSTKPNHSDIH